MSSLMTWLPVYRSRGQRWRRLQNSPVIHFWMFFKGCWSFYAVIFVTDSRGRCGAHLGYCLVCFWTVIEEKYDVLGGTYGCHFEKCKCKVINPKVFKSLPHSWSASVTEGAESRSVSPWPSQHRVRLFPGGIEAQICRSQRHVNISPEFGQFGHSSEDHATKKGQTF